MFDLTPEDGRSVTAATFQIGVGVAHTLLTGLEPGAEYALDGAGDFLQTFIADAAGLILVSDAPPGTEQAQPASACRISSRVKIDSSATPARRRFSAPPS